MIDENKFFREAEEAEKGLLASIIFNYGIVQNFINLEDIEKDIFFTSEASRVFQAVFLTPRTEDKYDLVTLLNKLRGLCASDKEFSRSSTYLDELSNCISYFNIQASIDLLKAFRVKRNLNKLADHIREYQLNVDEFDDQLNTWKVKFDDIIRGNQQLLESITAEVAIKKWDDLIERSRELGDGAFFKTGYKSVDKLLKRLNGGQLVVLASRPGIGKTTFALNLVRNNFDNVSNALEQPKSIGFFSLEMDTSSLMSKLISIDSGVDLESVRRLMEGELITKEETKYINSSKSKIAKLNLLFCDDTSVTIGTIAKHLKSWIAKHNLKLVIIDYLQLISSPRDRVIDANKRYQEIGLISRQLKILAMEMNVCILALAQLNRKVEERRAAEKAPILSDLRESGSIEQDADVVMFLYEETNEDSKEYSFLDRVEKSTLPKLTVLKIAKNRSGPTGLIEFAFNKSKGTFVSCL